MMRWLALVLLVPLLACEPRVIVTRTPSPSGATSPSASIVPSPTPTPVPTKVALRPVPNVPPANRLLSYELASDIPRTQLRFLLTDDGRVITEESGSGLRQRKLTPSGTAAMVLRAIETGLFERDASYAREPVPGTTPPGRGPTFVILVVANAGRDVRVSFEPTGQPDDEQYQKSATREKLTAFARAYEDLSWVTAAHWAESTPLPYRAAFHRLFVLTQPNIPTMDPRVPNPPDADAVWPFLTPIDSVGEQMSGTSWRCAVLVDADALTLGDALARANAATSFWLGSTTATAGALKWRGGGSVRLEIVPLLPHEPATCAGAPEPL